MGASVQGVQTLKVHVKAKQKLLLLNYTKSAYGQVYLPMQIANDCTGLRSVL